MESIEPDPRAVSGAPGEAYCSGRRFGSQLRDVFIPVPSPLFTNQGFSGRGSGTTASHHRVRRHYIGKSKVCQ